MQELPVPPEALTDNRSIELVRIWAASGKQYVTLDTNLWEDPAAWGVMMVDLAKHVANAYKHTNNIEQSITLDRIKSVFDLEWEHATDTPTGRLFSEDSPEAS